MVSSLRRRRPNSASRTMAQAEGESADSFLDVEFLADVSRAPLRPDWVQSTEPSFDNTSPCSTGEAPTRSIGQKRKRAAERRKRDRWDWIGTGLA